MLDNSYIIDAHSHLGDFFKIFTPFDTDKNIIKIMDKCNIRFSILSSMRSLTEGENQGSLDELQKLYEKSNSRIYYYAVFDPRNPSESLDILKKNIHKKGLLGIKLHPSMHETSADSNDYSAAWELAKDLDLIVLAHTWSCSPYNPKQQLSKPMCFHNYIKKFPSVRFILGHCGGRGHERFEAIKLLNDYENVYADFSGDIFCYRLLEILTYQTPSQKILFGSDYPWFDPMININRIMLADIPLSYKRQILYENAYKLFDFKYVTLKR